MEQLNNKSWKKINKNGRKAEIRKQKENKIENRKKWLNLNMSFSKATIIK